MIFVTVGSQKFPFDRLVRKVDQMVREGLIHEEVFIQTGATRPASMFPHAPIRRSADRDTSRS